MSRLLDVEEIDRDLFRAQAGDNGGPRETLYGGQVAAQALSAAGRTVDPVRVPHSLHRYSLRPGNPEMPVIYHVDRERDGGSFSARQVRAVQAGEVIFSILASFHAEKPSQDFFELPLRSVPDPDEMTTSRWGELVEFREVTKTRRDAGEFSDCMWVRVTCPLPDDRLTQACALTFVSDLGSAFGQLIRPGLPRGGPSVDHALWLHAPIRAEDWVLIDLHPTKVRGIRGLYSGILSDRQGTVGAFLQQELLLRWGPTS